ncbi:hypothetical protein [Kribbella sp. NBC_00889]|uniref:hypothetical protein n=1 Tax=Kribbella sp. NBC_00889 TaxID=2975974 RepID=UPI00386E2594|nr:hypothetical protein OG817_08370 [Kribbella sp. NBC_00889]
MTSVERQWLKLGAGSEYNKYWERYFSIAEEERVTALAEGLVPEAQRLESAMKWYAAPGGGELWIVLVLHPRKGRLLRAPGRMDAGQPHVETVLPWDSAAGLPVDEQQRVIIDRLRDVFDELMRRGAGVFGPTKDR